MKKSRDYHLAGDFHTPESTCPYCGKVTNGAAGPEAPEPGAISICIGCYNLGIFDDDLKIRKPTVEEFAEIRTDPQVWQEIEMVRHLLKTTDHFVSSPWKESKGKS
jgi:NAD-dependent SIR2 family protein deacetylase